MTRFKKDIQLVIVKEYVVPKTGNIRRDVEVRLENQKHRMRFRLITRWDPFLCAGKRADPPCSCHW